MDPRALIRPRLLAVMIAITWIAHPLLAQESPVRRVANIVSVAVEEYKKGIDATGRVTSVAEYSEAVDFLLEIGRASCRERVSCCV